MNKIRFFFSAVNGEVSEFDWKYDEDLDENLKEYDFDHSIPNANFIFHNKLPKSGPQFGIPVNYSLIMHA